MVSLFNGKIRSFGHNNYYRVASLEVPVPHCCCSHHYACCSSASVSGIVPTVPTSQSVSSRLDQLDGDTTVYVFHNIHCRLCHSMSVCIQLAVADWSGVCVPGLDCADHLSTEVAINRNLCFDVPQHPRIIPEHNLSCSLADHCFWTSILHAAI